MRWAEIKRDTTQVPAHFNFRCSTGCKALVPGEPAGKCGARIVLAKAEVSTYYSMSYSFR